MTKPLVRAPVMECMKCRVEPSTALRKPEMPCREARTMAAGPSIAARLGLSMTYVAPCFIIRKIRTGLPMILTEPMTPITFDIIWFL